MKYFYRRDGIGSAKYTVNFHDGQKTHADGSPFYDMRIFRNKRKASAFVAELRRDGYETRPFILSPVTE